ncbi:MAG: purine-nucleoside phosphorylase [Synergistaceae bacterium]|jgi:purine-nucleoside phosphorylase|nr:purine-nucleoside phosphorylase [Synergistaceae bacterium]
MSDANGGSVEKASGCFEKVMEAVRYLKAEAGSFKPRTAVVLGSGLGKAAGEVAGPKVIEAKNIPHWPHSTAPGHAGQVILGEIAGRSVILLKGRVHYYEGYDMEDVVFSTRVLGMLGVEQYIATNASGGIGESLDAGDIVLVEDHINHMGANPLRGPTEPRWNERFPDMTRAYSPRLLEFCESEASRLGISASRGVYIAFSGPSYETPAEIRMARLMGASVVGMSTVPEIIAANAMGMENAVISCVANKAAGTGASGNEKLTEEGVLAAMEAAAARVGALVCALIRRIEES